jgi:MFS family permease
VADGGHPRVFPLLLAAFAAFGFLWGAWAVLIADLSRALDISPGPLGVALALGAAASIPAMLFGGRALDRWGRRAMILLNGALMGLGFGMLALVDTYGSLVVLLVVVFANSGAYDVGINAAAMDLERASKRRVMSYLHAAFSGGGMAGALAAGALVSAGMGFRAIYPLVTFLLVLVLVAVFFTRTLAGGTGPEPGGRAGFEVYRNPAILLLAALAALSFLSEGTMENWSAIYLRGSLELPALLGASGVAVFHAAMLAGRLGAAGAVLRFGRRNTLLASGALAALGMSLALATDFVPFILAGFLLVGVSLAAVAPISFSLAGDVAPDRAGQASSVITTVGYSGFLFGPVIIGGLGEIAGLRLALATIILAGALIFALSLWVREGGNVG